MDSNTGVKTTYRVTVHFSNGSDYTHTDVAEVVSKSFGRIEIVLRNGQRYRYAHVINYDQKEEL